VLGSQRSTAGLPRSRLVDHFHPVEKRSPRARADRVDGPLQLPSCPAIYRRVVWELDDTSGGRRRWRLEKPSRLCCVSGPTTTLTGRRPRRRALQRAVTAVACAQTAYGPHRGLAVWSSRTTAGGSGASHRVRSARRLPGPSKCGPASNFDGNNAAALEGRIPRRDRSCARSQRVRRITGNDPARLRRRGVLVDGAWFAHRRTNIAVRRIPTAWFDPRGSGPRNIVIGVQASTWFPRARSKDALRDSSRTSRDRRRGSGEAASADGPKTLVALRGPAPGGPGFPNPVGAVAARRGSASWAGVHKLPTRVEGRRLVAAYTFRGGKPRAAAAAPPRSSDGFSDRGDSGPRGRGRRTTRPTKARRRQNHDPERRRRRSYETSVRCPYRSTALEQSRPLREHEFVSERSYERICPPAERAHLWPRVARADECEADRRVTGAAAERRRTRADPHLPTAGERTPWQHTEMNSLPTGD